MPTLDNVSVIVPSWRRPEMLRDCLTGLARLETQPAEVLVVARPDDLPTLNVLQDFSYLPVKWVQVERPGNVAPIEAGLAAASTGLVAILDDDAVPREGWLTELIAPFADGAVACVGGHAPYPGSGRPRNSHPGRRNWFGRLGVDIAQVDSGPIHEVDTVQECNWAWRTSALRSIQFDANLDTTVAAHYGLDLTLRAKKAGWKILYNPAAVVDHYTHTGSRPFDADRVTSYTRNITLITLRHCSRRQKILFLMWALAIGERASLGVLVAGVELLTGREKVVPRFGAALKGRTDAVRIWISEALRRPA